MVTGVQTCALPIVLDYLPSPLDVPPVEGYVPGKEGKAITRASDEKEPFSALAFKVATHPFYGKLVYVRVYSGKVSQGEMVLNATKGKKERIGKLFQMHSNKENPVEQAHAGHIYAFIGLKDVTTGDTLCAQNAPIILESMTFPDPVIHKATIFQLEPETIAISSQGQDTGEASEQIAVQYKGTISSIALNTKTVSW